MKNILLLFGILLFEACQKQPTANFNTDKTTYYAGETIHCKDASTNAHHWLWTMPSGSTYTTQNVDYVIDTNDLGGYKQITLQVTSRFNNKKSTVTKKGIHISQPIYSSDYFAISNSVMYPVHKTLTIHDSYYELYFDNGIDGGRNYNGVIISLSQKASTIPNGAYAVINNSTTLQSNQASIYEYTTVDGGGHQDGYTGQILITATNKDIQIVFKNVRISGSDTSFSVPLSGHLIFKY